MHKKTFYHMIEPFSKFGIKEIKEQKWLKLFNFGGTSELECVECVKFCQTKLVTEKKYVKKNVPLVVNS